MTVAFVIDEHAVLKRIILITNMAFCDKTKTRSVFLVVVQMVHKNSWIPFCRRVIICARGDTHGMVFIGTDCFMGRAIIVSIVCWFCFASDDCCMQIDQIAVRSIDRA